MTARLRSPFFLPVLASTTPAVACLYVLPYLIAAAVDGLRFHEAKAGLAATLEVAAMASASFAVAPVVSRASLRRTASAGCALALVGNAGSIVLTAWHAVFSARLLAGLGAGAALAAGQAAAARAAEPQRLFARVVFWRALGFAFLMPLFPLALGGAGHRGVYACMAAMTLACLLGCRRLPPEHGPARGRAGAALDRIGAGAVLTATVLFAVGDASLWSFSERLGLAAGLPRRHLGIVLSLSVLSGLVGSALAARTGSTHRSRLPVICGCSLAAAAAVAVSRADGLVTFGSLLLVYNGAVFFMLPFLFGCAAQIDPGGRVAAAAGGALLAGTAVGPTVAGLLFAARGSEAVGGAAAWSALASLLLLLVAIARLREAPR